jgi:hypothetical protein
LVGSSGVVARGSNGMVTLGGWTRLINGCVLRQFMQTVAHSGNSMPQYAQRFVGAVWGIGCCSAGAPSTIDGCVWPQWRQKRSPAFISPWQKAHRSIMALLPPFV